MYPREWQCETVTMKEHEGWLGFDKYENQYKVTRKRFAPGSEPPGHHDVVTERHEEEDHTTFDDNFNLDNVIKEKRDSEKAIRTEQITQRKQRARFGQQMS